MGEGSTYREKDSAATWRTSTRTTYTHPHPWAILPLPSHFDIHYNSTASGACLCRCLIVRVLGIASACVRWYRPTTGWVIVQERVQLQPDASLLPTQRWAEFAQSVSRRDE